MFYDLFLFLDALQLCMQMCMHRMWNIYIISMYAFTLYESACMHLLYMNLHDYKDCKSLTQSQCFYNISNNIPSSLRANCAGFPTCMDDAKSV